MIECFEVYSGRRMWGWECPKFEVFAVSFDFRAGSFEVVVALSLAAATSNPLLILEADLNTGESRDLGHAHYGLFPEYLILVRRKCTPDPRVEGPMEIHLDSMEAFDPLWRHLSEFDLENPVEPAALSSVSVEVPDSNCNTSTFLRHVTFFGAKSPVHDHTYEFVVNVTDLIRLSLLARVLTALRSSAPSPSGFVERTMMSRYHVTLPTPQGSVAALPPIALKSVFSHSKQVLTASWTGYTLARSSRGPFFIHQLDEVEIRTLKRLSIKGRALVTHSGAMVVQEPEEGPPRNEDLVLSIVRLKV
ncbi:hypothetical protein B0H19DRAFT_1262291 [Mycena capillaripes]|nr:hypothetical protein B0H19DRAFT_1262291 [Mycena capillaripes]